MNNATNDQLAPASHNASRLNTLESLEAIIQGGKLTYVAVGNALREINGRRLYADLGYTSFEVYCRERFGFSRSVGYDYIKASTVGMSLQSNPPSYSQAVVMAALPLEQIEQIAETTDFSKTTVRELQQRMDAINERLLARELDTAEPPAPVKRAPKAYTKDDLRGKFYKLLYAGKLQRFELAKSSGMSRVQIADHRHNLRLYGISESQAQRVAEVLQ